MQCSLFVFCSLSASASGAQHPPRTLAAWVPGAGEALGHMRVMVSSAHLQRKHGTLSANIQPSILNPFLAGASVPQSCPSGSSPRLCVHTHIHAHMHIHTTTRSQCAHGHSYIHNITPACAVTRIHTVTHILTHARDHTHPQAGPNFAHWPSPAQEFSSTPASLRKIPSRSCVVSHALPPS